MRRGDIYIAAAARRPRLAHVKALLDEQLSPQIAVLLRQRGFDVGAAADRSDLVGCSDR